MLKQEYLRPHDITVLLQLAIQPDTTFRELADRVALSLGEAHNSARRLESAHLVIFDEKSVNYPAAREFLLSGVPYAFPARLGAQSRGIRTAFSAPPLAEEFPSGEVIVWEDHRGDIRGDTLAPLSPAVGKIWERNKQLYALLAIVDALRIGRSRERKRARHYLEREFTLLQRRNESAQEP